ncbi:vesicle transport protein SFT2B isoform X1 [Momordica charantia]|uniref:Vesicle transport protein n=1 Tax=Momordica charantia TaxID=3673 RepID=A0A6J1CK82_MOMCH|nr:vesicle transport protein SFT2B isoform X1 [Momordica charantia]
MWKLSRGVFGDDEERGQSLLDEDSEDLCSLSPVQRLYGFGACLTGGVVCMVLAICLVLMSYTSHYPASTDDFVRCFFFIHRHCLFLLNQSSLLYYLHLAMFWQSEAFLFGPGQQIRMMFDSVRIYATAIYLGCVVLALICALWIHNKILTVIAIISEICALIWYSLSYIPFARRMVSELMIRLCDTEL